MTTRLRAPRPLGSTGLSVPLIGDGAAPLGKEHNTREHAMPLDEKQRQQLIDEVQPLVEQDGEQSQKGKGELFWLHDTKVMGWQREDEPALVAY